MAMSATWRTNPITVLPFYLEKRPAKRGETPVCYYTQFGPALASLPARKRPHPLPDASRSLSLQFILYQGELYRMLRSIAPGRAGLQTFIGYNQALEFNHSASPGCASDSMTGQGDEGCLRGAAGEAYTVLSTSMNRESRKLFTSFASNPSFRHAFLREEEVRSIEPLLNELHWHYAAGILESAEVAARSRAPTPC